MALGAVLASAPAAAAPGVGTPADIYGTLFEAVQQQRVFEDGKTFADAVPTDDPDAILQDFARQRPASREALRAFVLAHFRLPGKAAGREIDLRTHIRDLWPQLIRQSQTVPPGGSALSLPEPYVVPGGRFREIYYWDSYFTMLGLRLDGRQPLVESMIADFVSLIERFGHIPNGTRTYYLSRSQPPFFALMLDLSNNPNRTLAASRLAALRQEHGWWMKGGGCLGRSGVCMHVVRMPDGSLLNRYWDERDTPRDESWAEDRATAVKANRPAGQVQRDLRSAAESGWDFSARWLRDPNRLSTIHTTDIVPIDLNALLWVMEKRISTRCAALGDASCSRRYEGLANKRKAAINRYLWHAADARYADWDRIGRQPTKILSAATLYPLFVGLASPSQARDVARTAQNKLLASGGSRTTTLRTGQQWDAPNGWAPLQWIAIDGLARYGEDELAREIAQRWVATVRRTYHETGKMLEKYDIEERKPGGGGEYPLQDGFGWTNGVTSAVLDRYPDLAAEALTKPGAETSADR